MTAFEQVAVSLVGVLSMHLIDRISWRRKTKQAYRSKIFDKRFEAYLRAMKALWGYQVVKTKAAESGQERAEVFSILDNEFVDGMDVFRRVASSTEDFRLIATVKTWEATWKVGKYLVTFNEEARKQEPEQMIERYNELVHTARDNMREDLGIDVLAGPDQMQEVFGYVGKKAEGRI